MMGKARRHVRRVSMMDKARRREGGQGAQFSRLILIIHQTCLKSSIALLIQDPIEKLLLAYDKVAFRKAVEFNCQFVIMLIKKLK